MRSSLLVALILAVALAACGHSAEPLSQEGASEVSPSTAATPTPTVLPSTTATTTIPRHTPVWLTVKYRSEPVDVAADRFDFLDGGSSSLVDAAFYDSENGYMIVSLNGTAYHYCDVPQGVWSSFTSASSLGSYFNTAVKGQYDCRTGFIPEY